MFVSALKYLTNNVTNNASTVLCISGYVYPLFLAFFNSCLENLETAEKSLICCN